VRFEELAIKELVKTGFETIDRLDETLKQLHDKGIYIADRDIENVKRILKAAVLGGLAISFFMEVKDK
jgi:hypothetical protein